MLEPVVTLDQDGKTAKGRWRVLAMLGSYGGKAVWAGGIYENEYILENGVWKINDLHYYSRYTGGYGQAGWTADKEAIPIHYDPARAGVPVQENPNLPVDRCFAQHGDAEQAACRSYAACATIER